MIRILIVDDDKLARKGLISIMPWSSHDMVVVGEAANGAKALEFLRENSVDLVFVDLSMPIISGIELIEASKRDFPNIRFVVLTFHEDFKNVQQAVRLGVLDYISKLRLETEDYDEILNRIHQSVLDTPINIVQVVIPPNCLENDDHKPTITIQDNANFNSEEEKWLVHEKEWHTLYWLYDETAFLRLCTQLLEEEFPIRRIEGLFMRIIWQIEADFQFQVEVWPNFDNIQTVTEWIQLYRDSLYAKVTKMSALPDTMTCIMKAILFIHEHISTSLSADAVAANVNMSRSYFSQCFKKLVGLTFNVFIRQERIRLAEQLLSQTNHSIPWIANAVGYEDSKYFSHVFHELTQQHPSVYRVNYNKGDK